MVLENCYVSNRFHHHQSIACRAWRAPKTLTGRRPVWTWRRPIDFAHGAPTGCVGIRRGETVPKGKSLSGEARRRRRWRRLDRWRRPISHTSSGSLIAGVARVRRDVARVLPRPREAAVIKEDVALLELARDALLLVLLDGRGVPGRSYLELLARAFVGISSMKLNNWPPSWPPSATARDVVPQTQLVTVMSSSPLARTWTR